MKVNSIFGMNTHTKQIAVLYIFVILLFSNVIFANLAHAQSKVQKSKLEDSAIDYFDSYQYHLALPLYLTLYKLDSKNSDYIYPIAYSYLFLDKNEEALPYFEQALQEPEKYPLQMIYYAARTYHLSGKYDYALKYYEIYKNYLLKNKINIKNGLVAAADKEIQSCINAKELVLKPMDITVVNLGAVVNSEFPEYGPVLSADQGILMFTSNRPNTTGGKTDELDGKYYEDIYICYKTDTGWTAPEKMGSNINTNGHDASIGLSADGQKLLFYRYNQQLDKKDASGDLYYSNLEGNVWMPAIKFPESINSGGWEPSATLSSDQRTLLFTSDRKNGFGGTDIYTVKKLPNGDWALPQNIGNVINTEFDEDSPYLHPDGKTLYFSSNGHKTMGGMDIFKSKWDEEKKQWSTPENVGVPINTPHDDLHFSWSADGRRVYFSSVRPSGLGDRDLYYADINVSAAELMLLKGNVLDIITKKPISANIQITDVASSDVQEIIKSNSETGKYLALFQEGKNYKIELSAPGYKTIIEELNIDELHQFKEEQRNFYLTKVSE